MSGTKYRAFAVAGIILLVLFLLWGSRFFFKTPLPTIESDLEQFSTLGAVVKDDFSQYPLLTLTDEYTITDTLKDGIAISYGSSTTAEETVLESPDLAETLSLQFPETLSEPLVVTLPQNRLITITHNSENSYRSELLYSAPEVEVVEEYEDGGIDEIIASVEKPESQHSYIRYMSADTRVSTYYAYQKDVAAGYRNLKHWTIFKAGSGEEAQSYTFSNAHLQTNDRGEVEVRYIASLDESKKTEVGEDLWARAQQVISQDMEASIDERAPDLIIPAPYTIDANGNRETHEWVVTKMSDIDPADTSNAYRLSVSFTVPLLGYPIALDPTLQFTAPGVNNAGEVITGEVTAGWNYFGYAFTTGDFNADGIDDLAAGAYANNYYQGGVYVFYGGFVSKNAGGVDVILIGESSGGYFGGTLTTGDLNNDGVIDLIVGAGGGTVVIPDPFEILNIPSKTYVFYGGSLISESAAAADVILTDDASSNFGTSLVVSDFNADGKDDLVISAPQYNSSQGRTYLFFGGSLATKNASAADVILTGEAAGDQFGGALTAGDFNRDGLTDLAVGASGYIASTGRVYVFYGGTMRTREAQHADVIITGEKTNGSFGAALLAGNLSGNGVDNLVVGASGYDVSSNEGRVYVFMSEAATQRFSRHQFQGTIQFQGTGKIQ